MMIERLFFSDLSKEIRGKALMCVLWCSLFAFLFPLSAYASSVRLKSYRMSDGTVHTFKTRSAGDRRVLPRTRKDWDSERIYKAPVILMSYSDRDFLPEHDIQFYKDMLGKKGFNPGCGQGCVADYFRDQSLGKFNLEFDVVSVKTTYGCKITTNSAIREAIIKAAEYFDYSDSDYDWDGNGEADVVIVIFAGYGGNQIDDLSVGCYWPETDYIYINDLPVEAYSCSNEIWVNDASIGIGTLCHELSHILGLPDLYPKMGDDFSVVDEWDLMDGGCFSGDGWCPPNFSIQERELLGWATAETLEASQYIADMPVYDGSAKAYKIVNPSNPNECYYIENRQWEGWDYMLPGHGMLITHVNYSSSAWRSNIVNGDTSNRRYDYLHADGITFNEYYEYYNDVVASSYGEDGRNLRLRTTAYPYTNDEGVESTIPSLFGTTITDLTENDGLLSFRFRDAADGISTVSSDAEPVAYFDIHGRRISEPGKGVFIVKYSNGITKKIIR
jgi:M6 family metalloprotease-like protein